MHPAQHEEAVKGEAVMGWLRCSLDGQGSLQPPLDPLRWPRLGYLAQHEEAVRGTVGLAVLQLGWAWYSEA